MEWEKQSEILLNRVPFFVRKMVRRKVEEYAVSVGAQTVTQEHVHAAKQKGRPVGPAVDPNDRFSVIRRIENIPADQESIPMYAVEACQADGIDCPMSVAEGHRLTEQIHQILEKSGLTDFITNSVSGPLLPHHRFKVSISSCPNSCSQAQIKDVGIIAQLKPKLNNGECSQCGQCVEACREGAIALQDEDPGICLDAGQCVYCGVCIRACPTDALDEEEGCGYALYLGGRLGRRPRLGEKAADLLSTRQLLAVFERIVSFYTTHAQPGERFSHVVERLGLQDVAAGIELPFRP